MMESRKAARSKAVASLPPPPGKNDKGEYAVLNDVRMAYIRLVSHVYLLVYVSTYCVPIAHLRQNKAFPLLYLGHAQIIKQKQR